MNIVRFFDRPIKVKTRKNYSETQSISSGIPQELVLSLCCCYYSLMIYLMIYNQKKNYLLMMLNYLLDYYKK